MEFKDKVVLVTGGSRGIGRAVALRFAYEGAKVLVNGYDTNEYADSSKILVDEIIENKGNALFYNCDISKKTNVKNLFDFLDQKYGNIDILVANAGICPFEEFLNIDENLLDKVVDVNLKGSFFCAQEAMQRMIVAKTKGRLVFTSSVSANFGGELQAHYCATKGAINQLMKSIAIASGKYGITSNAVLPGTVLTDINRKELEADPKLLKYFEDRTPIGRLVTPDEVASAALFFASDNASGISGATLIVDGGMSVNLQ
jgi:L-rhamnose 1-dehydrogenase